MPGEHFVVPPGIQREFVIGQDVRAFLDLGQVVQNDDRDLLKLELPGGEETAVTGDDTRAGIHENRIIKSELRDAGGYLGKEFSYDGLHLSPKGYEVWRDAIAPGIAEFCAP